MSSLALIVNAASLVRAWVSGLGRGICRVFRFGILNLEMGLLNFGSSCWTRKFCSGGPNLFLDYFEWSEVRLLYLCMVKFLSSDLSMTLLCRNLRSREGICEWFVSLIGDYSSLKELNFRLGLLIERGRIIGGVIVKLISEII